MSFIEKTRPQSAGRNPQVACTCERNELEEPPRAASQNFTTTKRNYENDY